MLLIRGLILVFLVCTLVVLGAEHKRSELFRKYAKIQMKKANNWIRHPSIKRPKNPMRYFRTNPRVVNQIKAEYN